MADEPAGADESVERAASIIQGLMGQMQPKEEPEPAPEAAAPEPPAEAAPSEAAEPAEEAPAETETEEPMEQPETPQRPAAKATPARPEKAPNDDEPDKPDPNLAQLNSLVPQLQAAIQGEFADIKSWDDLQKLATDDPARYNRYVIRQAQLQQASAEQQRLAAENHGRWFKTEQQKLTKALPDLFDAEKGPKLKADLRAFAKRMGYDDTRVQMSSAADVVTLHKAMLYEKLVAEQATAKTTEQASIEKAKEKAAKAPPVQKPGTVRDNSKADRAREDMDRLKKTGRLEDAAKVFQHILG